MKRIVFTVAIGKGKYGEMAAGLARSLIAIGDDTPRAILTDLPGPWDGLYDLVVSPKDGRTALDKLLALDLTDADQVIALDCDSLAFRPLGEVFEYCEGEPFAVQGDEQSEGTWHDVDVRQFCEERGLTSIPRFNGGFLYYERSPEALELIERARRFEREYEQSGFGHFRGNASEEVCVVLAMLETGFGSVLPDELDFMSTGVGLIGKLHMNVANGECWFLCRRSKVRFIRPWVFHAARYSNFLLYWKQLDRLKKMSDRRPVENFVVSSMRAALARMGFNSYRPS